MDNKGSKKKHISFEEKKKVLSAYKKGQSITELSELFNIHRVTIHRWIRRDKSKDTLKRKIHPGSGRFHKIEEKDVDRLIKKIKKPATKFGFENSLWTTKRVQILCKQELGLKVSRMSIWRYLKEAGQSCKKVQKNYNEADEDAQYEWATKTVRKIKRTVKKHHAILYFEDESNISLSPVAGTSWSPVGEKITAQVTGSRGSVAAISAVSNDGRLLFSLHNHGKRFNSDDIIDFFYQMLSHHSRRHLVVVMDQAPCHVSKKVREYIDSQKRLHVFYLPPYSPEFNPDEKVWNHLKNIELKDHQAKDCKGLKKIVRSKLKKISQSPKTVHAIFNRCDYRNLYM